MCYINQIDIKTTVKLFRRELAIDFHISVRKGFDFSDWPIIKSINNGTDVELEMAHWELLPRFVQMAGAIPEFRRKYNTLNAKSENLLQSQLYASPARNGRCLVLSSGFYEGHHQPKIGKKGQSLSTTESFPYFIHHKKEPVFFMAGISQVWTDMAAGTKDNTFSIVTTKANGPMRYIHNNPKNPHRMPTILNREQAEEWLQPDLSDERIFELASTQLPDELTSAYPIKKSYYTSNKPTEPELGTTLKSF